MNRLLVCAFVVAVAAPVGDRQSDAAQQQAPRLGPTSSELERRDQPVTAADVRILTRARDLLKDESVWNRADDRECADDEATRGRDFEHRLRDFNNLPSTRLADVRAVLQVALDRVKSRLKK